MSQDTSPRPTQPDAARSAAERFPTLGIVGAGLIGSSIARATARFMPSVTRIIVDADEATAARAGALGLGTVCTTDMAALEKADLVIFAVPVGAMGRVAEAARAHLKPGAVVSDVGSVKASVALAAVPHMPEGCVFVPAHPVAGTENSGPDAGFDSLFIDRWSIITPVEQNSKASQDKADEAAAALETFWQALGSKTATMTADHHDRVLAITSHVPHLIAYNIVGTASDLEAVTESEVIKYSAGGFRDFTRIAASDPVMWRDVFLNNKDAVLEMLQRFSEDLSALQRAIRWDDGAALEALFRRTRLIRRDIIEAGQDSDLPDFGRTHAGDTAHKPE